MMSDVMFKKLLGYRRPRAAKIVLDIRRLAHTSQPITCARTGREAVERETQTNFENARALSGDDFCKIAVYNTAQIQQGHSME